MGKHSAKPKRTKLVQAVRYSSARGLKRGDRITNKILTERQRL